MIIEFIFNSLVNLMLSALDLLPSVDVSIPEGVFNVLEAFMVGIPYVLPITGLMPIFAISMAFTLCKIVWATIIRIKSFIPTMGN